MDATLPFRAGINLKAEHYRNAIESKATPCWFEVHAENYMGDGGPTHWWLDKIRQHKPISLHGVGMSIGSENGLDHSHLDRLAAVVNRFEPASVSEHLAWSSHNGIFFNDLLPLPYHRKTLDRVCRHVDLVQNRIGRPILLENPSTYIEFENSDYAETTFLSEVSRRSGCGLLLDINNVFVSAHNQGDDPIEYLDEFPLENVGEIHLAGHATERHEDASTLLIDTHDREVCDAVWSLYSYTLKKAGPIPTLIEWDANIPEWDVLSHQAELANKQIDSIPKGATHAIAR